MTCCMGLPLDCGSTPSSPTALGSLTSLPITSPLLSIWLVVGPAAHCLRVLLGWWRLGWQYTACGEQPTSAVCLLAGAWAVAMHRDPEKYRRAPARCTGSAQIWLEQIWICCYLSVYGCERVVWCLQLAMITLEQRSHLGWDQPPSVTESLYCRAH